MNERIKGLINQAHILAAEQHRVNCLATGKDPSMPHPDALNMTFEKFAELIVRECMILVKDCYKEPESGQSPYQTVCASTIIEEHFGVEE